MVQDSFGDVPVDLLSDSAFPLDDQYMPVCLQKHWRESWGYDAALPPDCTECRPANGGGLRKVFDFMLRKHPGLHIGMVSRTQDGFMRLFFSSGNDYCANYDNDQPITIMLRQFNDTNSLFPADVYSAGLSELRILYAPTGRVASFFIGDPEPTYHQHLFRPSFYESLKDTTVARWAGDFSAGTIVQVGPYRRTRGSGRGLSLIRVIYEEKNVEGRWRPAADGVSPVRSSHVQRLVLMARRTPNVRASRRLVQPIAVATCPA
jgi:hypothetical protein